MLEDVATSQTYARHVLTPASLSIPKMAASSLELAGTTLQPLLCCLVLAASGQLGSPFAPHPLLRCTGLTLTEEYASIRTILRIPGGNPFAIQRQPVAVGPTRCEVTGILVRRQSGGCGGGGVA